MRILTTNQRRDVLRKIIANCGGVASDAKILGRMTDQALLAVAGYPVGNARRRVANEGADPNEASEYYDNDEVSNEEEDMLEEDDETDNEDMPPELKEFKEGEETDNEDPMEEEKACNEEEEPLEEDEETDNTEDAMGDGSETVDPGKEGTDSVPNANRRIARNRRSRPVGNAATKNYLRALPPEVREIIANATRIQNREKMKYVKVITANSRFKASYLMGKKVAELREMARMVGNSSPRSHMDEMFTTDYSGASAPTHNAARLNSADRDNDILEIPTINWKNVSNSNASKGAKRRKA